MYKLLYFLSGTDIDVIAECNSPSKSQQLAKGFVVVLIGLIFMFGCGYGLYFVFNSLVLAFFGGSVFGFVMLFFYRMILSARTNAPALFGFLFAILFGIIISVPIELKIFEKEIQSEISVMNSVMTIKSIEEDPEISRKENEIRTIQDRLKELEVDYFKEVSGITGSRVPGIGPVAKEKKRIYEDYKYQSKEQLNKLSADIEDLKKEKKT